MSGKLYLVPTPIDNESSLNNEALELFKKASTSENWLVVVEEHKDARRRWLHWGLAREPIEDFICYNEHSTEEDLNELITALKSGKNIAMMSDCGLPAFCDPGQKLVYRCHKSNIPVTAMPFSNSVVLSLALSGLNHDKFSFYGFLPKESSDMEKELAVILKEKQTAIFMDTPYRLGKVMKKLFEINQRNNTNKEIFIGMDLNKSEETLLLMDISKLGSFDFNKREFVAVVGRSRD